MNKRFQIVALAAVLFFSGVTIFGLSNQSFIKADTTSQNVVSQCSGRGSIDKAIICVQVIDQAGRVVDDAPVVLRRDSNDGPQVGQAKPSFARFDNLDQATYFAFVPNIVRGTEKCVGGGTYTYPTLANQYLVIATIMIHCE